MNFKKKRKRNEERGLGRRRRKSRRRRKGELGAHVGIYFVHKKKKIRETPALDSHPHLIFFEISVIKYVIKSQYVDNKANEILKWKLI